LNGMCPCEPINEDLPLIDRPLQTYDCEVS
jgi:hypothetical protein